MRAKEHHRNLTRCGAAAALCVLLCSCGKNEPPKDKIVNAIAAVLPAHFKIVSAEVEFIPDDEKSGTAKAKLQVSPKEDVYVPADTDPDVLAAGSKEYPPSEVNAYGKAAKEAKVRLPADMYPRIDQLIQARNQPIRRSNLPWIRRVANSGDTMTVYGSASVVHEFKEWRVANARVDQDLTKSGAPRSAFPRDALLTGSPEAAALVEEIANANSALDKALSDAAAAVDRLVEEKQAGEAEVAKRKEAINREQHAAILATVAKGRRYEGRLGTEPVAVEFVESNPTGSLVRARIYNPADPTFSRFFTGRVVSDPEKAHRRPIKLSAEKQRVPVSGPGLYTFNGCDVEFAPTGEGLEGSACDPNVIVVAKQN